jgi:hypothetical protein
LAKTVQILISVAPEMARVRPPETYLIIPQSPAEIKPWCNACIPSNAPPQDRNRLSVQRKALTSSHRPYSDNRPAMPFLRWRRLRSRAAGSLPQGGPVGILLRAAGRSVPSSERPADAHDGTCGPIYRPLWQPWAPTRGLPWQVGLSPSRRALGHACCADPGDIPAGPATQQYRRRMARRHVRCSHPRLEGRTTAPCGGGQAYSSAAIAPGGSS